ncbi:hypothetical protein [Pelagicoccus sp. SDUM812005]|uniref:hypothetical protein n=1 Tax=Pelagicoccus sp. SDUM812005 TaxID=3041257 RepID=UPI00280F0DA8|nr:hypothetical protein [Pelagicoccus sp. SDUM812005]MDQ8180348.1 hypothetical protein [Pelagicoccus sp. SDUM812005]
MKWLDRDSLREALSYLGRAALEEGLELEICLYGGSAMLLAYDSRAATKDVDAVIKPVDAGKRLAAKIAKDLQLHEDWLNDDVRQFLSPDPTKGRRKLSIEIPGLRVFVATANYLLAMKAIACRRPLPGYRGDHDDLVFLIKKIGIRNVDEIQARIDQFFHDEVISEEKREVLESLIKEANDE